MRLRTAFAGLLLVAAAAYGQDPPAAIYQYTNLQLNSVIPYWEYSVTAQQNATVYNGLIVGANPTLPWKTTVPVMIVPVIVKFVGPGFTWTFDPTQPDTACLGSSLPAAQTVLNSPLFTQTNWTFNTFTAFGAQFLDAEMRSEFANAAGFAGTYSPRVDLAPSAFPPLTITVTPADLAASGSATFATYAGMELVGQCGAAASAVTATNPGNVEGVITQNFNPANNGGVGNFYSAMAQYLAQHEILWSQMTMFVPYKSILVTSTGGNVCGMHGNISNNPSVPGGNGANLPYYTYVFGHFGVNDGYCGSDTIPLARQVVNWAHDPFPTVFFSNTPPVGGTIAQPYCAAGLETGNPVPNNYPTVLYGSPQFTYHFPEVAYFDWYFGLNSSTVPGTYTSLDGAGGKYSDDGSFTSPAALCGAAGAGGLGMSGGGLQGDLLVDSSFEPPPTAPAGTGVSYLTETAGTSFGGASGTAWTVVGDGGGNVVLYSDGYYANITGAPAGPAPGGGWYFNVADLTQAIDLTGSLDNADTTTGVTQTFATTAGKTYTLSFFAGALYNTTISSTFKVSNGGTNLPLTLQNLVVPGTAATGTINGDNSVTYSWLNSNVPGTANPIWGGTFGGTAWAEAFYTFTATGASTTITFLNNTTAGVPLDGLDDVQVSIQ